VAGERIKTLAGRCGDLPVAARKSHDPNLHTLLDSAWQGSRLHGVRKAV